MTVPEAAERPGEDTRPELFRAAVDSLTATRVRREVTVEPLRPPQRLAPYSYALSAEILSPGGLLAVVELDGFPRFLPDGVPADRPGLEERCREIVDRRTAEQMPARGADFGPKIVAAGFATPSERAVAATVTGSPAIARYAAAGLGRIRAAVADALPTEDLAALDRLLDPAGPEGLLRRDDLVVRTTRTVWAARPR